ncbi:hypothetical protein NPIL_123041 [Nephila pilipes]|uniref:Secreted protein n=1 Tax=Nephila pilipes TaxID=299642 RepID=A0A8X6UBH6_NEPPI|nr:hypothetical protein NPIL_123041 [Nephila pilipes]
MAVDDILRSWRRSLFRRGLLFFMCLDCCRWSPPVPPRSIASLPPSGALREAFFFDRFEACFLRSAVPCRVLFFSRVVLLVAPSGRLCAGLPLLFVVLSSNSKSLIF